MCTVQSKMSAKYRWNATGSVESTFVANNDKKYRKKKKKN